MAMMTHRQSQAFLDSHSGVLSYTHAQTHHPGKIRHPHVPSYRCESKEKLRMTASESDTVVCLGFALAALYIYIYMKKWCNVS